MLKFFCNRCGALMDTGEAFAPTELSCPACRAEVESAPKVLPPLPLSEEEQALAAPPPPAAPMQPPDTAASSCHTPAKPSVSEPPVPRAKPWIPLVRRAVAATLLGGTITFASLYFTLWTSAENKPAQLLGGWIAAHMVIAVAGTSLGLIAALIMLAFKKPFGRSFANAYSLSVLVLAVASVAGGFLSAAVNRRLQVLRKEVVEERKSKFDGLPQNPEK